MEHLDETLWEKLQEHFQNFDEQHRAQNNTPLLRGNLVPALVMAVLPGGNIRTAQVDLQALGLLSNMGTEPAVVSALVDRARDLILQAFYASCRYEHVVAAKAKIGASLRDLIQYRVQSSPTVPNKLTDEAFEAMLQRSYALAYLPTYCWGLIASFLPTKECLALPQVGSIFFAERNEIVWKTIYFQCFGEFTAKELRLVNPWDDFEIDSSPEDREVEASNSGGDNDESRWVVSVVDYHRNLRVTLMPFLCAAKPSYKLRPSPEDFLQNIAPKGSIMIGSTRFLLTNMAPLHFVSIPSGKAEVVMEEIATCLGTVYLLTAAVMVRQGGHPHAAYAVASPAMRRDVVSLVSKYAWEKSRMA